MPTVLRSKSSPKSIHTIPEFTAGRKYNLKDQFVYLGALCVVTKSFVAEKEPPSDSYKSIFDCIIVDDVGQVPGTPDDFVELIGTGKTVDVEKPSKDLVRTTYVGRQKEIKGFRDDIWFGTYRYSLVDQYALQVIDMYHPVRETWSRIFSWDPKTPHTPWRKDPVREGLGDSDEKTRTFEETADGLWSIRQEMVDQDDEQVAGAYHSLVLNPHSRSLHSNFGIHSDLGFSSSIQIVDEKNPNTEEQVYARGIIAVDISQGPAVRKLILINGAHVFIFNRSEYPCRFDMEKGQSFVVHPNESVTLGTILNEPVIFGRVKQNPTTHIGMIAAFATAALPPGWQALDGTILKVKQYPELARRYAHWVEEGDIILPDLKGTFLRSTDGKVQISKSVPHQEGIPNIVAHLKSAYTRIVAVVRGDASDKARPKKFWTGGINIPLESMSDGIAFTSGEDRLHFETKSEPQNTRLMLKVIS